MATPVGGLTVVQLLPALNSGGVERTVTLDQIGREIVQQMNSFLA